MADNMEYGKVIKFLESLESVQTKVVFYLTLTKVKSWAEAKMKVLNAYFKDEMGKKNLKSFSEDGVALLLTEQDKSTLNQEKMVALLDAKGYGNMAVKTVRVVDEEKLSELVYGGQVTPQEIDACMDKKIVKVLRASEVKA